MNTSLQTLRGSTRLVFDSIEGVTNTVERMHEAIVGHVLPEARSQFKTRQPNRMTTPSAYAVIRGINSAVRDVVDLSLGLAPDDGRIPRLSAPENRMVSALNGAVGDHLEDTGNPLAASMTLFSQGEPLELDSESLEVSLPEASPHLVILVHGYTLSELSWQRGEGYCVGSRLQEELGHTPLYLRYNSGRHISTNGQEFDQLLQQLCDAWPVPVESVSLIGHSMGGLIIRSACWYAEQAQSTWLSDLQRVVFLGTPHHGAPLAKASHAFSVAMRAIPYAAPFAVGGLRSEGAMDLRNGDLIDEDWEGYDPDQHRPDTRKVVPLLPHVDYYFAAASLGNNRLDPKGHILGDLLVDVDSALGSHKDRLRQLNAQPENCRIFHGKNHLDLLDDEIIQQQIIDWFDAD